jgi:hypothetical protein
MVTNPHSHQICILATEKLQQQRKKDINDLSNTGMPPKLIYNYLYKAYRDSLFTATYIYNIRYRLCTKKLHGLTPIQALFSSLKRNKSWHYRHQEDHNGHIINLFLVHNSDQACTALSQSPPRRCHVQDQPVQYAAYPLHGGCAGSKESEEHHW